MTRWREVVRSNQTLRTITTINPVIGDESFIARFGRLPTRFDDPRTRVASHVGYAARLLRARAIAPVSARRREQRPRVLDALDAYVAAARFPDSETDRDLAPTFVDPSSQVRCAVAALVEVTAGTELMAALDRSHHNAYIADLAEDPRFAAWARSSGLTLEELAIIQPSYPPPPPTDVLYVVAAEGLTAHDDSPAPIAGGPPQAGARVGIALVDGSLRVVSQSRDRIGRASFQLDGKLGLTSDDHTAYDARAMIGAEVREHHHALAYGIGIEVSAFGSIAPRAWTLPLDLAYHYDATQRTYGVHAGPRFTVAGERRFGWQVGVDLRVAVASHETRFYPSELVISLDVTRINEAVAFSLTLGAGNERGRQWYE
ncbi:hypothetical protein BH11MYX1_BH11MYX1_51770 [soil metagenome]